MAMSVNLMVEQTAANGGAKPLPRPASVSSSATFSPASNAAAASAKNGMSAPAPAKRPHPRPLAMSRIAKPEQDQRAATMGGEASQPGGCSLS
jgi:hypothetical protein